MNTSKFMDIQTLDLSSAPLNKDLIDISNPGERKMGDGGKEEIPPSHDFQLTHPSHPPHTSDANACSGVGYMAWNSADYTTSTVNFRDYSMPDSNVSEKVILEKDQSFYDAAIISEIDCVMKKHTDILLHALDNVGARISQLEIRTHHLESSVDDLKFSAGNNQGSIDEKMRLFENILQEVQTGVNDTKHKQENFEAHRQPTKLQVSKAEERPETMGTVHGDAMQSAPQFLPNPNTSVAPREPSNQHYPMPSTQYTQAPLPQYSQSPPRPATITPLQLQPSFIPPPNYSQQPCTYELPPPSGKPSSGYGHTSNLSEPYSSTLHHPWLPAAPVMPAGSGAGRGSGSMGSESGNRIPVEGVVDKVASMGFPREHVRETVRRLTDNGQAVDLNVVLDKLMNDAVMHRPREFWFSQ